MLLVCVLLAGLRAPAQPTTDAEVWTAVVAQLCNPGSVQQVGCVFIAETWQGVPKLSAKAQVVTSAEDTALMQALVQRNSAPGVIRNIQLPPGTLLVALDSITPRLAKGSLYGLYGVIWESFKKEYPQAVMFRLSLPAFSEDGTKAIVYYIETGGFDDSRGGSLIFEKKDGRWVVVKVLGYWIT